MRRIVAILLCIVIGFWILYGLFVPFKNVVNDVALNVLGPAIWGAITAVGSTPFWLTYGSYIMLATGAVVGFVIYHFWHKADWSLRRWAASRTSKDLGTTGVTQLPSTPPGATTRPETEETRLAIPKELTVKEETKAEETTTT